MADQLSIQDADNIFTSLGRETIKVYQIFDGSTRVITRYEALENVIDGGPCLKTTYTYTGANTVATKMKEEKDVWSASYDI